MKINTNKTYNLTVEEAYKLLNSKKMTNNKCNLENYTNISTKPGNNRGGKKSGTKNKMTLAKLAKIVEEGFARQEQFNQFVINQFNEHGSMLEKIDKRINSIISKNNLKE